MRLVAAAVAALLVALVPPASAQIESCGEDLQLFIRNPDIGTPSGGQFHVSGSLLVQFQVIGDRADEVEAFALSFGYDIPTGEEFCDLPAALWLTGAYLEGYSLDTNKEDGFFIAINSNGQTSPQGDLGVAVHAYDASSNEIGRFWGAVRNDNCGNPPELGCPGSPAAAERDKTMPWPVILPGDGEIRPVNGFAVEFNEKLADYRIELNGQDVTDAMTDWTDRPIYDQDYYIGGPQLLFDRIAAQCTLPEPIHECGTLAGPGLQWTERQMTDDDVIRVIATDLAGNVATKEIHIGSSVAGGAISDGLPILQMTFEESSTQVEPGQTAVFRMNMQNTGGGEGHPFARAVVPEGWDYQWVPGHRPVPAGGSSEQELHVTVPELSNEGVHTVEALIDYRQGSQDKSLKSILNVAVAAPAGAVAPVDDAGDEEASPAPALVVLALLAAAFVRRR